VPCGGAFQTRNGWGEILHTLPWFLKSDSSQDAFTYRSAA
jgi:hypothetical protein